MENEMQTGLIYRTFNLSGNLLIDSAGIMHFFRQNINILRASRLGGERHLPAPTLNLSPEP